MIFQFSLFEFVSTFINFLYFNKYIHIIYTYISLKTNQQSSLAITPLSLFPLLYFLYSSSYFGAKYLNFNRNCLESFRLFLISTSRNCVIVLQSKPLSLSSFLSLSFLFLFQIILYSLTEIYTSICNSGSGLGSSFIRIFRRILSVSLSGALTALRVAKLDWKIGQHFVLSLCFVCVCVSCNFVTSRRLFVILVMPT